LSALTERTRREWDISVADAEAWCARAVVSGGRDELRRATGGGDGADVKLTWITQAGVTYPSTASVELPPPPEQPANAALACARDGYRRAVDVAVRHAAASAAAARVAAERAATIRRLRAIEHRWVPALEQELAEMDVQLEETEREEITRLRWAHGSAVAAEPRRGDAEELR
jgi:V/A-type H+-transporting ATPase subunit D